jgi:hypothetical protein
MFGFPKEKEGKRDENPRIHERNTTGNGLPEG